MEIYKRASQAAGKFEVVRAFSRGMGQFAKPGEKIEVENPHEAMILWLAGKIKPILPAMGIYIALGEITLPGKKEKFTCKKMELVELRDVDAVPLLLSGSIIPKDPLAWRPFGRRLKLNENKAKKKLEQEAIDKAIFEDNCAKTGILQGKNAGKKQSTSERVTVKFREDCAVVIDGKKTSYQKGDLLTTEEYVANHLIEKGRVVLIDY